MYLYHTNNLNPKNTQLQEQNLKKKKKIGSQILKICKQIKYCNSHGLTKSLNRFYNAESIDIEIDNITADLNIADIY